jgi:hypothetical protein
MSKADRGIDNTMPPIFNRRKTSMFDNIDSMARIESEIERRMEAACEKNGWYVANAQTKNKPYGII